MLETQDNSFRRKRRRASRETAKPEESRLVSELRELFIDNRSARDAAVASALRFNSGKEAKLPKSVYLLLARIVDLLDRGESVSVVPNDMELTIQQAADILNVSPEYFEGLLDANQIASRNSGDCRHVRLADLLDYKSKRDRDRSLALSELSKLSQEFGGYEEASEHRG